MSDSPASPSSPRSPTGWLSHWLLEDRIEQAEGGPYERERKERQQSWWKVTCLTGVDYFSTLGYQPGIAALAAGALSPVAVPHGLKVQNNLS